MATPSPDRFDPCRAWLGIERADLADPRRVLGLLPAEADPIVVLKAAETRLKALKGLAAGEHHAAREALILQVEQARERVLSQIAAAAGNGGSAGTPAAATNAGGFSMPPPPHRRDRPEAPQAAEVRFDDPAGVRAAAEPALPAPLVRVRSRLPARRQGNAAIWVSLLAMVASVAAGAGFIWWQSRQEDLRQKAREQAVLRAKSEGEAAPTDDRRPPPPKPLPGDAPISSSPPPVRSGPIRKPKALPVPKPAIGGDESGSKEIADARMPNPASEDIAGPTTDEAPAGDDTPQAAMEDTASSGEGISAPPMAAGEDAADEATIDEPTSDEPAGETTANTAAVDGAVGEALAALRIGDFDTADATLASALEAEGSVPSKRRISDWQTLAQYAREFDGFRAKAIAEVKPGNEFDVNGKKVAVVEIDDKKFIYRFQGRNKTTPRTKIPAAIGMAIVSTWFDERPANHLFLGAHHATKPEPDLPKARDHWERAEKGGINAEPLLRLLDDPALQGSGTASDEEAE